MFLISLGEALIDDDGRFEVVGAELIDGVELGLSSTNMGSREGFVGDSDNGLPEGAAMIDGDDDVPLGLVEGFALRGGQEEGLDDGLVETLGGLLGSPLG